MDVKIIVILTLGVISQHLVQGAVPAFTATVGTATIAENAAADTPVTITGDTTLSNTPTSVMILDTSTAGSAEALSVELNTGKTDIVMKVKKAGVLDRETNPTMTINIRASNADGPTASDFVLTLTLTDYNDNAPKFAVGVGCLAWTGATTEGTLITTLAASDADDTGSGVPATGAYSFTPTTAPFTMEDDGKIKVKTGETLTAGGSWVLTILAVDEGTPKLTGTVTYTICEGDGCCVSSAGFVQATAIIGIVALITLYI